MLPAAWWKRSRIRQYSAGRRQILSPVVVAPKEFFGSSDNWNLRARTAEEALEHRIIDATFPNQKDAVSTVRLLQLATQRATNGTLGVIELNNKNYQALGESASAGHGSTKLKDYDSGLWSDITAAFSEWDADYVRILVTPAAITNTSGSYKGMAALIIRPQTGDFGALISGNQAVINGGFGQWMKAAIGWIGERLNYGLTYLGSILGFNSTQNGAPTPAFTPQNSVVASSPEAQSEYLDMQSRLYYANSGGTGSNLQAIQGAENSGFWGRLWAGARQVGTLVYDPVDVISGAFYHNEVDLVLPGPFPLELRRTYSSQNLSDNEFGYGWRPGYAPYLILIPNGSNPPLIQASDPDGAVVMYRSTGSNIWTVTANDNPALVNNVEDGIGGLANAFNSRIEKGADYTLFGQDGSKRTFKVMSFPITTASSQMTRERPYLVKWEDHAENSTHLSTERTRLRSNMDPSRRFRAVTEMLWSLSMTCTAE